MKTNVQRARCYIPSLFKSKTNASTGVKILGGLGPLDCYVGNECADWILLDSVLVLGYII